MSLLVISIYDRNIDFSNDLNEKNYYRYGNMFVLNENYDELKDKIHNLIMEEIGGKLNLVTQKLGNIIYMKIYLISVNSMHRNDIDYLVSFLEKNLKKSEYKDTNEDLESNGKLIKISTGECSELVDLEHSLNDIKLLGVEYEVVLEQESIYNHGASGITKDIIVSICGGVGTLTVQAIVNKLKEKRKQEKIVQEYIVFGDFDKNRLLLNFAREIKDENIKKYHISNFDKLENNMFSVAIESKDMKYNIVCNENSEIISIKTSYIV